jgi:hypothetical protein
MGMIIIIGVEGIGFRELSGRKCENGIKLEQLI